MGGSFEANEVATPRKFSTPRIMTTSEEVTPPPEPFQRSKSRSVVYYESEALKTPTVWKTPNRPNAWLPSNDLHDIREDGIDSNRERSSGESSPVSPGGSFRFSRRSPSHKSQDSGFSDSGESNGSPELLHEAARKTMTIRSDAVDELAVELEHKSILPATEVTELKPPSPCPSVTSDWSPKCSSTPKKDIVNTSVSSVEDPTIIPNVKLRNSQGVRPKTNRRWSSYEEKKTNTSWSGHEEVFGEGIRESMNRWSRVAADPRHANSLPRKLRPRTSAYKRLVPKFDQSNPVHAWLRHLGNRVESECLHTLQSKSLAFLASDGTVTPSVVTASSASTLGNDARDAIFALQQQAHLVSTEFAKLCQRLEYHNVDQLPPLVQNLVGHIMEFVGQYNCRRPDARKQTPSLARQQKSLLANCKRLRECDVLSSNAALGQFVREVTALGHAFTALVDVTLSREVKVLVDALEDCTDKSVDIVREAIQTLASLGLDGEHLCKLIAKEGGVRALLALCLENKFKSLRAMALRALATICCVAEAIRQLEKSGGVDVLSELICDSSTDSDVFSEAAGVIAQITSPWIEGNHRIDGLEKHVTSLVRSLTSLAGSTTSSETFLLAAAALANLTFMEQSAAIALSKTGSVRVLIAAVRSRADASVFLQDQVATVIANLSAIDECRADVIKNHGVVALLCFLQRRPSPLQSAAEIAACERVQQKSAIALSRLCNDTTVAKLVVELQGPERLVRLCKDERERNHSDGVLVACLAALRKIASVCGHDVMKQLDASELVEPRLLDSFLIFSSRQESYV